MQRESKQIAMQGGTNKTLFGPNNPLGWLPGPNLLTLRLITNVMSSLRREVPQWWVNVGACPYTHHTIRHAAALQTMTHPRTS